jgi:uncharacterized protein YbjT (DUF2867 family)
MKILLTGATGFIGTHVKSALEAVGHTVVMAARHPPASGGGAFMAVDYGRDTTVDAWLPRLAGIDAVINAVGIIREDTQNSFAALHEAAPKALFAACAQAGVRRVIQISALGADEAAATAYHLSKKSADDYLAALDLDWVVLQPSIVHGSDGASSRYFRMLASMPVLGVPGDGRYWVQPIHIDDLAECVVRLFEPGAPLRCRIPLAGPCRITYRDMLLSLREQLGLPKPLVMGMPMPILKQMAKVAQHIPGTLLTPDTLSMLERGNVADVDSTERLLNRPPRAISQFLPPHEVPALRAQARMDWLLPVFRLAIALVWLVSGVVSLGLFPIDQSLALLAELNIQGAPAYLALYALSFLDIGMGVATLAWPSKRLTQFQLAIVLGYTLAVSLFLPAFWLHPFGPILKNLPILVSLLALIVMEEHP